MDHELIKQGVSLLLEGLGLDIEEDPNFRDTPDRVARAYEEIFQGMENTEAQIREIMSKTFPCTYSQMVVAKDIECFSMCPHHLLPVRYSICAAYIPSSTDAANDSGGQVLGVSKLCRVVEVLAKRPVLQEQLVEDVTEVLMQLQGCLGAACIGRGEHYCMTMRGVKQRHASVVASSLKGVFLEDEDVRSEFMQLFRSVKITGI